VPITEEGNRYLASAPPPLQFRLNFHEAVVLLIATRLYAAIATSATRTLTPLWPNWRGACPSRWQRRCGERDDDGRSTGKRSVRGAIEALSLGWFRSRKVRLGYRSLQNEEVHEHVFSPYFIEAAGVNRSTYAIGA